MNKGKPLTERLTLAIKYYRGKPLPSQWARGDYISLQTLLNLLEDLLLEIEVKQILK